MSNTTEPRTDGGLEQLTGEVAESIRKTQRYLLSIQRDDGHWCGELEGDSILGSEYIMAMMFIGRMEDPKVPIKLIHKMSEAQVKKEIGDPEFGLKWKETIGVLPRQHIVIFERPAE